MKKIIRKTAALAACIFLSAALCACDVQSLSTLREFSRTYLGEYECVEATYGGTDLLYLCRYVHLTLEKDGTFTVAAKSKAGFSEEKSGRYLYEEESGTLTFYAEYGGRQYEKRSVLERGAFTLSHSLKGRELVLKFQVKS